MDTSPNTVRLPSVLSLSHVDSCLTNKLFFRSIQNWVEDLYWKQCDFNYPGVSDAMVRVVVNLC